MGGESFLFIFSRAADGARKNSPIHQVQDLIHKVADLMNKVPDVIQ